MKTKLLYNLLILCIVFASCGPEPVEYRTKFTGGYSGDGSPNCDASGTNCWLFIKDPMELNRTQTLNNFYQDLSTDNLARFFQVNDWHQLFPADYSMQQADINKIISKEYGVRLTRDSSIVIIKSPKLGLAADNVLFVVKRAN